AEESDVFTLSGAADSAPALGKTDDGLWRKPEIPPITENGITYIITRYRPRIEGLFARIERWVNQQIGAASARTMCIRPMVSPPRPGWPTRKIPPAFSHSSTRICGTPYKQCPKLKLYVHKNTQTHRFCYFPNGLACPDLGQYHCAYGETFSH
ncbi:MAG TPA: SpvB/TcaC N-terminal domain-containing protein, partial [Saprospiraceae bacterium]|nr:SpvB/TcaC N-terminal domain-containing protein [Saprospiraceae bacterium]